MHRKFLGNNVKQMPFPGLYALEPMNSSLWRIPWDRRLWCWAADGAWSGCAVSCWHLASCRRPGRPRLSCPTVVFFSPNVCAGSDGLCESAQSNGMDGFTACSSKRISWDPWYTSGRLDATATSNSFSPSHQDDQFLETIPSPSLSIPFHPFPSLSMPFPQLWVVKACCEVQLLRLVLKKGQKTSNNNL